jgi:hypothetical protein
VSESYGLGARQEKLSSVTSPAIMETPQPRHQSLRIVKSRRLKRAAKRDLAASTSNGAPSSPTEQLEAWRSILRGEA